MVEIITIGELRRLTAQEIPRLKATVIIRSGQKAIGCLSPLRSVSPRVMAEAKRRYWMQEALRASGDQAIIEEVLKGFA